jgi:AP-1 complex subunit mu
VIISRDYRGDIESNEIDKFMPLVMEMEDDGSITPILRSEHTTFA